jgi:16S rRNA (guanine527-N7)-methyltransferase
MTTPPPPPEVAALFGDRMPNLLKYAERLATVAVPHGFLGPHERARIWCRHIVNSAAAGELIPVGHSVVDLGSGAGLPGVVLALRRPDLEVTLVESSQRRAAFLTATVADLDLAERVRVRRDRAENLVGQIRADVVVARAVGPLARVAGWAGPLLRPGGRLLVLRGAGADTDVQLAASVWQRAGFAGVSVVECGRLGECPPTRIVHAVAGRTPGRAAGLGRGGGRRNNSRGGKPQSDRPGSARPSRPGQRRRP